MKNTMMGRLAFYAGLIVSAVAGWMQIGRTGVMVLAGLGVLVGLLNVTEKESHNFLLATLVLISAGLAMGAIFGGAFQKVMFSFIAFSASAAFIVALKEVYNIEKSR